MALTGSAIKAMIEGCANTDEFCQKLAQAIVQNIEIKLPAGCVIIQVAGSAVGTPNPASIDCEVS